jgi:hypothetical protein
MSNAREPAKPNRRRTACALVGCLGLLALAPCLLAATPLIVRRSNTPTDRIGEVAPGVDRAKLDVALDASKGAWSARSVFVTTLWDQLHLRPESRVVAYERGSTTVLFADGLRARDPGDALRDAIAFSHPGSLRRLQLPGPPATASVKLETGDAAATIWKGSYADTHEPVQALVLILAPYPNDGGALVVGEVAPESSDGSFRESVARLQSVLSAVPAPR